MQTLAIAIVVLGLGISATWTAFLGFELYRVIEFIF
jgi:hypothetical protein